MKKRGRGVVGALQGYLGAGLTLQKVRSRGKQQPLRGVGWGLRTDHPKTGAMQAKKRLKNRSVFVTHPTPELDCPPLSKKAVSFVHPTPPGFGEPGPPLPR